MMVTPSPDSPALRQLTPGAGWAVCASHPGDMGGMALKGCTGEILGPCAGQLCTVPGKVRTGAGRGWRARLPAAALL